MPCLALGHCAEEILAEPYLNGDQRGDAQLQDVTSGFGVVAHGANHYMNQYDEIVNKYCLLFK